LAPPVFQAGVAGHGAVSDLARQVALARIWSRRLQATSVTAALASRTRRAARFTSSGSSGASTDYPPPVALKS